MHTTINLRDKNISVNLTEKRINIFNDDQLSALVTGMPEAATEELVSAIKKEFRDKFRKDFDVTDNSMAVEIWGHVFTEKFADAIKSMVDFKWVDQLADKINSHCEVINIGIKGHDGNRFVWDWLAPFKSAIASILLKAG